VCRKLCGMDLSGGRFIKMKNEKKFSFLDSLLGTRILTTICIIFSIASIVVLTCIIYGRIHQKEVTALRNRVAELMEKRDELSELLKNTKHNYDDVHENLNRMESKINEFKKQAQEAQAALNSEISSLTDNLNICQNVNLNFISDLKEKEDAILSFKKRLSDSEVMTDGLKKPFVDKLVLEPTWIRAGEAYTVSNDDFAIVVDETSDQSKCVKDSVAIVSLMTGKERKNLCVGMDRPERFKYKNKKYSLYLLGIRENDQNHNYLITIIK